MSGIVHLFDSSIHPIVHKSDLLKRLSSRLLDLPEKKIHELIGALTESMISHLCTANTHIEIRGFGSFFPHYHEPRRAHNPKTGERLVTARKKVVRFKPSQSLQKRLNEPPKATTSSAEPSLTHVNHDDTTGASD